jgi:hypothetical protein
LLEALHVPVHDAKHGLDFAVDATGRVGIKGPKGIYGRVQRAKYLVWISEASVLCELDHICALPFPDTVGVLWQATVRHKRGQRVSNAFDNVVVVTEQVATERENKSIHSQRKVSLQSRTAVTWLVSAAVEPVASTTTDKASS